MAAMRIHSEVHHSEKFTSFLFAKAQKSKHVSCYHAVSKIAKSGWATKNLSARGGAITIGLEVNRAGGVSYPEVPTARPPDRLNGALAFVNVESVPPALWDTEVTQESGYSGGTNVGGIPNCSSTITESSGLSRARWSAARSAREVISSIGDAGCAMTNTVTFSAPVVILCPTNASTAFVPNTSPGNASCKALRLRSPKADMVRFFRVRAESEACAVNNARRTSNGRTKGARPMDNRRRRPGSGQGEPPRVAEWVGLAAADSTRNTDWTVFGRVSDQKKGRQRMRARVCQSGKTINAEIKIVALGASGQLRALSWKSPPVKATTPPPRAMSFAMSAPRVLARAVCVWGLAVSTRAGGGRGFAVATGSVERRTTCAANVGTHRARRACSTSAMATVRDGKTTDTYDKYSIHPITGDGRCLFRAVAVAMALRLGDRSGADAEKIEADRLRIAAVDDLEARHAEVEWFIEGDFHTYCQSMRRPEAWGGEPEILALANVLAMPIQVFMADTQNTQNVVDIGTYSPYGEDRSAGDSIAILFRGAGHYEALTRCET